MTILKQFKNILAILNNLTHNKIDEFLFCENSNSFAVMIDGESLIEIGEETVLMTGADLGAKILLPQSGDISRFVGFDNIKNFLAELNNNLVRLNHLGIGYTCDNFDSEILEIKKLLSETKFKLYEETAESSDQRWLFVGNLENWENPLFEIVLTKNKTALDDRKLSQFQIDLDTKLSIEELELLINKHFGQDFIEWRLDTHDNGVVLVMGSLMAVGSVKIYLGLGTDKRDAKLHREVELALV